MTSLSILLLRGKEGDVTCSGAHWIFKYRICVCARAFMRVENNNFWDCILVPFLFGNCLVKIFWRKLSFRLSIWLLLDYSAYASWSWKFIVFLLFLWLITFKFSINSLVCCSGTCYFQVLFYQLQCNALHLCNWTMCKTRINMGYGICLYRKTVRRLVRWHPPGCISYIFKCTEWIQLWML